MLLILLNNYLLKKKLTNLLIYYLYQLYLLGLLMKMKNVIMKIYMRKENIQIDILKLLNLRKKLKY